MPPISATTLFGRSYRLIFDGSGLFGLVLQSSPQRPGLRIAFEVDRDLTVEPNQGRVKIWNLSPEQRETLVSGRREVVLEAGFADQVSVVLTFDKVTVSHAREGSDNVTLIEGGDGQGGLAVPMSITLGPNASALDLLKKVAENTGLKLDDLLKTANKVGPRELLQQLSQLIYLGGKSFLGSGKDVLKDIERESGKALHVQDGQIQASSQDSNDVPTPDLEVTTATGLIGSPERFARDDVPGGDFVRFRTALLPGVVPGRAVSLLSNEVVGVYRVEKARHQGDTHGPNESWLSTVEARKLA